MPLIPVSETRFCERAGRRGGAEAGDRVKKAEVSVHRNLLQRSKGQCA